MQATQVEFTTNAFGGNDFFDISLVVSGPCLLMHDCGLHWHLNMYCTYIHACLRRPESLHGLNQCI